MQTAAADAASLLRRYTEKGHAGVCRQWMRSTVYPPDCARRCRKLAAKTQASPKKIQLDKGLGEVVCRVEAALRRAFISSNRFVTSRRIAPTPSKLPSVSR